MIKHLHWPEIHAHQLLTCLNKAGKGRLEAPDKTNIYPGLNRHWSMWQWKGGWGWAEELKRGEMVVLFKCLLDHQSVYPLTKTLRPTERG